MHAIEFAKFLTRTFITDSLFIANFVLSTLQVAIKHIAKDKVLELGQVSGIFYLYFSLLCSDVVGFVSSPSWHAEFIIYNACTIDSLDGSVPRMLARDNFAYGMPLLQPI